MSRLDTRPSPLFAQHSTPVYPPGPSYHRSLPPLQHAHSSSNVPIITAHPTPASPHASHSAQSKCRPKLCPNSKKSSGSNKLQQSKVQLSLEAKVERCKGFHAFFVPLARSLPPAPPSSPILGPSGTTAGGSALPEVPGADYFGSWQASLKKREGEEQWVEDIQVDVMEPGYGQAPQSMDLDP